MELERLKAENQALKQRLEAVSSPTPGADVRHDSETEKPDEAIALSTTTPFQVEASEPDEVTDKPPCPNCGEAVRIRNNGIRKNRDGIPISQRWRCNSCEKSWSEAIAAPS